MASGVRGLRALLLGPDPLPAPRHVGVLHGTPTNSYAVVDEQGWRPSADGCRVRCQLLSVDCIIIVSALVSGYGSACGSGCELEYEWVYGSGLVCGSACELGYESAYGSGSA